ncbi:MAG TPA: TadE/TadG family type IV pilus assembly protein, partial [Candidatus Dormibacteraeota bacterium]|nr:TadE/TadG family type IV pilus assembly protein [Candidatus Dormibacteraeota bacterium]
MARRHRPATAAHPLRSQRRRERAVGMVEFALVAPLFFVLLFGLIVGAIVSMNVVQLNNVVRDGARIAGLCGSGADSSVTIPENPSGFQTCSTANVEYYIV